MFNATAFNELIKDTNFLCDHIDTLYICNNTESVDTEEELREYLQDHIYECNIIYYRTACEFLLEHDCSFGESLEIASEYGYTTDKLNSELLATLLLQSKLNEELSNLDLSPCFKE